MISYKVFMPNLSGKDVKKPHGLKNWMSDLHRQKVVVIVTFMAVPLFLLILFTYFPFAEMFQFSFYDMQYLGPRTFVGFGNYKEILSRSDILNSLWLMFYYMVGGFIQLALAASTMLSFKTKGSGLFKAVLFFPYLIGGIAIGFIFKFFFTHGFVLDTVLSWIGFNVKNLPYWLKDTSVNNIALAGTSIWRYIGQSIILFIGAISSVDADLYEAAEIDGANAWNKFRSIIMPGISTIVILNVILSISGSISVFEPPYVITHGAFGTATFFVKMDTIAHQDQKVGLASAMAVTLMILIVIVTLIQLLVQKVFLDENDEGLTYIERRRRKKRIKSTN